MLSIQGAVHVLGVGFARRGVCKLHPHASMLAPSIKGPEFAVINAMPEKIHGKLL